MPAVTPPPVARLRSNTTRSCVGIAPPNASGVSIDGDIFGAGIPFFAEIREIGQHRVVLVPELAIWIQASATLRGSDRYCARAKCGQ